MPRSEDIMDNYDNTVYWTEQNIRALKGFGIGPGDTVIVSLPGMPEKGFVSDAIKKIGAVCRELDCHPSAKEVACAVKKASAKLCFCASYDVAPFCQGTALPIVFIQPDHSRGPLARLKGPFAVLFSGRARYHLRCRNLMSYDNYINRAPVIRPKA